MLDPLMNWLTRSQNRQDPPAATGTEEASPSATKGSSKQNAWPTPGTSVLLSRYDDRDDATKLHVVQAHRAATAPRSYRLKLAPHPHYAAVRRTVLESATATPGP